MAVETTVKRTCDICGKEMKSENGRLVFTWTPQKWLITNSPAGIILNDICRDCSSEINAKLLSVVCSLKR